MPYALVLFRFDPRSTAFTRGVVIPEACRHFRTITIEKASDVPGAADYWLHVYQLSLWFADVVVWVDLTSQSFSSNIAGEQSWLALQGSGPQNGEIALIGSGMSKENASRYGRYFPASILVDVDQISAPKTLASGADVRLLIGGGATAEENGEAARRAVAKAFADIAQSVAARESDLRQYFPDAYLSSRRLRTFFLRDRALSKAIILHNGPLDTAGSEPHPQDQMFATSVEQIVHGEQSRMVSADMGKHLAAPGAHGTADYHSLFAFITRQMTAATPFFWKISSSNSLFKGYLVLIAIVAAAAWPFDWTARRLRQLFT